MLELTKPEDVLLPTLPGIDVQIRDLRIDVEPSEFFLLPSIHIEGHLDIRFPC